MSRLPNSRQLLSRDDFREGVFARDGGKCVFCGAPAADAHHILERRLFKDPSEAGGYFLDNGASVCEKHHLDCEMTLLSLEAVREACGITKPLLPSHLYDDQLYDKWGNIILEDGRRLKGELFFDESVQKILGQGGVLDQFTHYVKYPRTYHLPWSEGMNDDDRMLKSVEHFKGRRVIVTRKKDGENTTMYSDYIHARSLDSRNHPSRNWVKNFWSQVRANIPDYWRVCGENLYAKHSIEYQDLPSYFMGFSVWNERNWCFSWDETLAYLEMLGIIPVPVLYDGIFDEKLIKALWDEKRDWEHHEGYVLRIADGFGYGDFSTSVAKFVRREHIRTVKHWMHGREIEKNGLIR